jgi:hypothetical protein
MTNVDPIITHFPQLRRTDNPEHLHVHKTLDWIREGKVREQVERIRQAPAEQRKALKEALPLVCFSGAFTKRSEAGLEEHSGLVCLDLDKIPENELEGHRAKLQGDPYTFALFRSPSGNGLKVLVRIPPDKHQHRQHYEALVRNYGSTYLDTSGKDPARACFLSWDPDLYVNPEALTFTAQTPTPETVLTIPEEQLDELTRRALLRAFPRPVQRAKLLDKLLEQVDKVNFRALACFKDDKSQLARKHYVVSVVEEVLEKARENKWDLCKNAAFILGTAGERGASDLPGSSSGTHGRGQVRCALLCVPSASLPAIPCGCPLTHPGTIPGGGIGKPGERDLRDNRERTALASAATGGLFDLPTTLRLCT